MPVLRTRDSRRLAVAALLSLSALSASSCAFDDVPENGNRAGVEKLPRVDQPVRAPTSADVVLPADPMTDPGFEAPAQRPNFLMITLDDAAWDEMEHMPQTQELLADQGVTLENALAPTPMCVPARVSLLTGQYAHNHGSLTISGENGGFESFKDGRDNNTLPMWLQDVGYDTLFTGKYLNGYGKKGSQTYVPPGWSDWRALVDPSTYNFVQPRINTNGGVRTFGGYSTHVLSSLSTEMLRDPARQAKPWFMWLNYVAPHAGGPPAPDDPERAFPDDPGPLDTTTPAPEDENAFSALNLPDKPSLFEEDVSEKTIIRPTHNEWPVERRAQVREVYQQRVESLQSVDDGIAAAIRTLESTGQLDNTYIVLTSDNGYTLGEHNLVGKLWYFREIVGVPMYIRGPGLTPGTTSQTPVTNADWAPTFAALARAEATRVVDGENVLPWITQPAHSRVIPIEAYPVKGGSEAYYRGVVVGPWTYVTGRAGRSEMYYRTVDPYELTNLRRDPRYQAQAEQLKDLAARFVDCKGNGTVCPKEFYG